MEHGLSRIQLRNLSRLKLTRRIVSAVIPGEGSSATIPTPAQSPYRMETSSPAEVSLTRQPSSNARPSQTNISASPSLLKVGNACSPLQSARSTSAPRSSSFANIHHFEPGCLTGDPRVARIFFSDTTPPRVTLRVHGSSCPSGDPGEEVQQTEGARRRHQYGPEVEVPRPGAAEDTRKEAAQGGACHPQDDSDDKAARVRPRHDSPGHQAHDGPDRYPAQKPHSLPPRQGLACPTRVVWG